MKLLEVNLWYWLVDRLPKKLIYFCFMKVMVHATTGKYGNTEVPNITGMEAIKRYGETYKVG